MLALLGFIGIFLVSFVCGLFIAPKLVGSGPSAIIMAVIIGCIGFNTRGFHSCDHHGYCNGLDNAWIRWMKNLADYCIPK